MHVTWWNIEGNEGTTNITIKNVNEKVFFSSSIAAEIAKSRIKNDTNGAYIRWRERKKNQKRDWKCCTHTLLCAAFCRIEYVFLGYRNEFQSV